MCYQQLVLQLAERRQVALCAARLAGGGPKHFGVWLDVHGPTIVASKLKLKYRRVRGTATEIDGASAHPDLGRFE